MKGCKKPPDCGYIAVYGFPNAAVGRFCRDAERLELFQDISVK
jgi:hypothetical protein